MFKKILVVLSFIFVSAFLFTACDKRGIKKQDEVFVESTKPNIYDVEKNYGDKKVAVVYFSATGNTKRAGEKIAKYFDCEMLEIVPSEAYSSTDLTSYDPSTRPQKEKEEEAFPKIENVNVKNYNLIFLGYPIWYGDAPRVIYTFIKENNLKGKTVIPFCTSDNSDISPSDNNIASYAGELYEDIVFMSGKRFTNDTTDSDIKYFITNLGPDIDAWR